MDDTGERMRAQAIVQVCRRAWGYLRGSGTPKQRIGNAAAGFSAYTKDGILSPHVRDVYNAHTLRGMEAALHTLQQLAEGLAEPESPADPDLENASRVPQESVGERPETKPPAS